MRAALDKISGKDDNHSFGGSSTAHDDPSSNVADANPLTKPSLVVGGTLLSPGPRGQNVNLVVYPKDKFRNYLQSFDSSQLKLSISVPDGTWENVVLGWSDISNGVQASFPRPSLEGQTVLKYFGEVPPIESDFRNVIQAQPSGFSLANSDVAYPQGIGCLDQGLVTLTPKDQYGQPRLGIGATPPLSLTFVNQGSGLAPPIKGFSIRNDSLLLPVSLKVAGTYVLTIRDQSDAQSQPRMFVITASSRLSPDLCIPYVEGQCSGIASQKVPLHVKLRDQDGNPYTPVPNENPDITVTFSLPDLAAPDISIQFSITADLLTAFYLRPAAGTHQILININDILLFDLLSTAASVTPSVTKSTFSIWSMKQAYVQPIELMAQGDQLQRPAIPSVRQPNHYLHYWSPMCACDACFA